VYPNLGKDYINESSERNIIGYKLNIVNSFGQLTYSERIG